MLQNGNVRAMPIRRSPQRGVAIAIVIALHAVVITAFLLSLRPTFFTTPPTVTHVFIPEATRTFPPRPPNPIMVDPTRPTVHEPVIQVQEQDEHSTIAPPPSGGAGNVWPFTQSIVAAQPIMGTHTIPPYPPIGTRLGHEGNVMLRVVIDPFGNVAQAQVIRSSGFPELDQAAAAWVRGHWRYVPASRNGVSVASTADITVTFRLTMR